MLTWSPIFRRGQGRFDFWAAIGKKMGVATMRTPSGLGYLHPDKKLAHGVGLLGQPLSRNHFFEILKDELPPPLKSEESSR